MSSVPNNEKQQTPDERAAELQDAADTLEGIGHDSSLSLAPRLKIASTLNGAAGSDKVVESTDGRSTEQVLDDTQGRLPKQAR